MTDPDIPSFNLNDQYFFIHKTNLAETGFGLDNSTKLIEHGLGVYSAANLRDEVGPLKSDFYRIALCLEGSLQVDIGVETFFHHKNTIHFHVPDRLFMMKNKSADLASYYLFFTGSFLEEILPEGKLNAHYPFFNYLNTPFFELSDTETEQIKGAFLAISEEIKTNKSDANTSIKLWITLILIYAKRSYIRQELARNNIIDKNSKLVAQYKKMVAQYFVTLRSVKDYAEKMAVSPNHLNKVIKQETGKSAGDFINDMLVMEIKALLRYSQLNISEIAYQLDFTDTSHLAKFFKKHTGTTPTQYRQKYS